MKRALLIGLLLHAASASAQDWGLDLTDESAKDGKLQLLLDAGITGAHLFLDGVDVGEAPGPVRPVKGGTHKVEVKQDGFKDFSKKIWIETGKLRRLEVKLEPVEGGSDVEVVGLVNVDPAPTPTAAAKVKTAGAPAAEAKPAEESTDRPEQVALTPSAEPDYVDPDLPAAKTELKRPKAWYQRWYVWAGAAVVVGAVVGGTVALASSSGQSYRPTPQDVCGRPCDLTIGQ